MAVDLSALKALVSKLEGDVIVDLEGEVVPALEVLLNSLVPAAYMPIVGAVEAAVNPSAQAALQQLMAKIPSLAVAPAAPAPAAPAAPAAP